MSSKKFINCCYCLKPISIDSKTVRIVERAEDALPAESFDTRAISIFCWSCQIHFFIMNNGDVRGFDFYHTKIDTRLPLKKYDH